jgi:hypothetical protein
MGQVVVSVLEDVIEMVITQSTVGRSPWCSRRAVVGSVFFCRKVRRTSAIILVGTTMITRRVEVTPPKALKITSVAHMKRKGRRGKRVRPPAGKGHFLHLLRKTGRNQAMAQLPKVRLRKISQANFVYTLVNPCWSHCVELS